MKKFVLGLIIGILISSSVFAGSAGLFKGFETAKLFVDGVELATSQPAIVIDGSVYAPIKELVNAMGDYYNYNPNKHEANVKSSILVYPTKIKVDSKQPAQGNIILEIDSNNQCSEMYLGMKIVKDYILTYKLESDNSLSVTTSLAAKSQSPITPTMQPSVAAGTAFYLYADDDDHTYLGKITNDTTDPDSIFYTYGDYGSKYNTNSIWNTYGTFGSKYSSYSPFNEYARTPPVIKNENGETVGRLTVNKYVSGAINPYEVLNLLK